MYRAMLECIETEAGAGKLSVVFVFHRGLRFTPNKVGAYYYHYGNKKFSQGAV